MLGSELVRKLTELIEVSGDLVVAIPDGGCGCCAGGEADDVSRIELAPAHLYGGDVVPDKYVIDL